MSQEWTQVTLGDIATVQSGSGFPKKFQGDDAGDFPFAKVGDMNLPGNEKEIVTAANWVSEEVRQELRAKVFEAGSIVFPKIGAAIATNKKRIVLTPCCVDNNVIGLIPNHKRVTSAFLFYWMQQHDLSEFANDSNPPSMRKGTIEEFPLEIPVCLNEQQRIVSILDEAFAAIDRAKEIAQQNLANARELFESYLNRVFTEKGEGWEEKTLGDVCEFENGDRGSNYPKKSEYVESGIPWINTGHILPDGSLNQKTMNFISKQKFESLRSGKIQQGDLVYCLRGATLGKTAVVDPINIGAVASSLVIIRPSDRLTTWFLYFYLTSKVGQSFIKKYQNGAAQPNLGAKSVSKYAISFPSVGDQKLLVEKIQFEIGQVARMRSLYNSKLAALDELKQSILQKAFTGQLTKDMPELENVS